MAKTRSELALSPLEFPPKNIENPKVLHGLTVRKYIYIPLLHQLLRCLKIYRTGLCWYSMPSQMFGKIIQRSALSRHGHISGSLVSCCGRKKTTARKHVSKKNRQTLFKPPVSHRIVSVTVRSRLYRNIAANFVGWLRSKYHKIS